LKPYQKIELLAKYLIPHHQFKIIHGITSVSKIREVDNELRSAVRTILHLPLSVVNSIIDTRKRDRELAFPKLEIIAVSASLKAGLSFLNSPDLALHTLGVESG
jgi:hypothetical protein